mmetsp:Transcript_31859/g.94734  ORF Transcript_31859/g.94734 Transcript_31859/m.94734 type:complete len:267 (+) Transcript_31859:785-1585(+)
MGDLVDDQGTQHEEDDGVGQENEPVRVRVRRLGARVDVSAVLGEIPHDGELHEDRPVHGQGHPGEVGLHVVEAVDEGVLTLVLALHARVQAHRPLDPVEDGAAGDQGKEDGDQPEEAPDGVVLEEVLLDLHGGVPRREGAVVGASPAEDRDRDRLVPDEVGRHADGEEQRGGVDRGRQKLVVGRGQKLREVVEALEPEDCEEDRDDVVQDQHRVVADVGPAGLRHGVHANGQEDPQEHDRGDRRKLVRRLRLRLRRLLLLRRRELT